MPALRCQRETGAKGKKVQTLKLEGVHLCCGKCGFRSGQGSEICSGCKEQTAKKNAESFEVTGDFNDQEVLDALQRPASPGKSQTKAVEPAAPLQAQFRIDSMAFCPEDIDYRIKKQFQDAGSDDPRRSWARRYVSSRRRRSESVGDHMMGKQTKKDCANGSLFLAGFHLNGPFP